ncbi:Chromate resistance protein ChrB [Streptomyces sp. NPDC085944]|uniref:Chromate resistance protein ChrB n=1 Tax=Streptomyces sp. NPDC085944 TaxID=3154962 RepID=UPI003419ED24
MAAEVRRQALLQRVRHLPDHRRSGTPGAPGQWGDQRLTHHRAQWERLRRRHRDLTARDVFGAPEAAEAGRRLKRCAAACEDYAEQVFAALHQSPETDR